VFNELRHPSAPAAVQSWISSIPKWLEVSEVRESDDPTLGALDEGEKSAITLGLSRSADLILIDDRKGAAAARGKGFEVTGTLGILDLAARLGMVDMADALTRLRTTNFRRRDELFDALLRQNEQGGRT
jgi:predicted nucleic acid-binding protein